MSDIQRKRWLLLATGFSLAVTVLIVIAQSGPMDEPAQEQAPGDPGLAASIRGAVGLGQEDVLPAAAGEEGHQAIITTAVDYAGSNAGGDAAENLSELAASYEQARENLVHAITWGEDADAAYAQLGTARTALAAAAGPLQEAVAADLPAEQDGLVGVVQENLELDPELRTLVLGDEQRAAIIAAQRQRDTVLLDARNWYADDKRADATAAFETALASILTSEQHDSVQANRQLLEQRMLEMATAELQPFEAEQPQSP